MCNQFVVFTSFHLLYIVIITVCFFLLTFQNTTRDHALFVELITSLQDVPFTLKLNNHGNPCAHCSNSLVCLFASFIILLNISESFQEVCFSDFLPMYIYIYRSYFYLGVNGKYQVIQIVNIYNISAISNNDKLPMLLYITLHFLFQIFLLTGTFNFYFVS